MSETDNRELTIDIVAKAKSIPVGGKPATEDEIALALAWGRGEVQMIQAAKALGVPAANFYHRACIAFQTAMLRGILVERHD